MNYLQMLAKLGIGSAHPGGFAATVEQFEEFPLPAGSRILEIGCGTGRTACYLAKQGYDVTALDISEEMLAKAGKRALQEGVSVRFQLGDVRALDVPDHAFDVVLVESVTNFVSVPSALKEYYRILKPGGRLFDREIIAIREIGADLSEIVRDFYGVEKLWNADEWRTLLQDAGFHEPKVWKPSKFPENMWEVELKYPDPYQSIDLNVYQDQEIWNVALRYDEIMGEYRDFFGFALMIGTKREIIRSGGG